MEKNTHTPHKLVLIGLFILLLFAVTKCTYEKEKRSYEEKNKSLEVGQVWHTVQDTLEYDKRIVNLYKNWVLFVQDSADNDTIAELRYWFIVNSEIKKSDK